MVRGRAAAIALVARGQRGIRRFSRSRIAGAKTIQVAVDSAKVTMQGPEQASVSFRQTYRSDKLNTKSRKTLELVKADGRWLIREEKAGK